MTFSPTVDQPTSDVLLPTLDGGNSSDLKEDTLSMRKERFLKFKIKTRTLMLKIEIFR